MYEWTFGVNGKCIIGRIWDEWIEAYKKLVSALDLSDQKRVVIYVHNLGYEFQWMHKYFEWSKVFSLKERKPVQALTVDGVEFKCSYILSGYSLQKLGEQLHTYKVQKAVGDLDYALIRHSGTPLTDAEIGYCVNDVLVVMAYIQEKIESGESIIKIPLTNTGYVRRYCKKMCMYNDSNNHKKDGWKYVRYSRMIRTLTLTPDVYQQLKRAFQGGFTHANAFCNGKVIKDVGSIDFSSSYPYVILSEKFPMSAPEAVQIRSREQFNYNLSRYCCVFDVEIEGLESINYTDHPLSASRCSKVKNGIEDNGRLVSADHLYTTWTEQDYFVMRKFYKWKRFAIANFNRFLRGYLPHDFIKAVLKLYEDKTVLKGVEGREVDYMHGKSMLNSTYGMMVTDICRDNIVYQRGEWSIQPQNIDEEIQKYNEAKGRFLYYPWGVWVTAYARRNLFSGIYEFGNDYVYADTDSIKAVNMEKHSDYILKYNEGCERKLRDAMKFHNIDFEKCKPKTIKGVEKLIGVWDFEGTYSRFKTLGAKRYMTEKHGDIELTVAGLNKKSAVPYLKKQYDDPFDAFNNGLYIPPDATGKNTHTYIDNPMDGLVTDYLGQTAEYHEQSGVHLTGADYSLSLSRTYMDYLMGIEQEGDI